MDPLGRQRSNQLNYVPSFVFLPLSEDRIFTGVPLEASKHVFRLHQEHDQRTREILRIQNTGIP
jgi:hypothetical protein